MSARVLLVENDLADARLIGQTLLDAGGGSFDFVYAERLASAVEVLKDDQIDLLLLDLSLPDESGLATLEQVQEAAPHVPVVILTGSDDEAVAVEALRRGAQDYLVKGKTESGAVVRSIRYAIERSRSERARRESEERYRFLFDHNPHPMWVLDAETLAFLAVNNAALQHYGYTRQEFLALNLNDLRPPGDTDPVLEDVRNRAPGIHYLGIRRHRTKDGTIINVELTTHALEFGNRLARLVLANDVTERIRLEEQLRQSQKMEAVGRLAGGVAHDFNNLLTVITGYGQMMLNRLRPEDPMFADLEEILNAASRAAVLTGQLLAFSRRRAAEPRVFDLNAVVAAMDKMLRRLIGEDIQLTSILSAEAALIKADAGQIEQVIMNLVVNARDAMPRGGKVVIETANVALDQKYSRTHLGVRAGNYVMLAVSDSGRGMDSETKARLFEPFFTTKEPGKGTGLGLSTVYGIVKQFGGEIWVYSEPDFGTTFKIYFPRVRNVQQEEEPKNQRMVDNRGVETVLLVEDDTEVRSLIRRVLLQQGYRVLEASGGHEALSIAKHYRGPIHLLFTDVVMNEMSGRELAGKMVPIRPELKVLYMSGYTENAIVQFGELDPGTHFIQKPFRPDSLASKLREVLDLPLVNSAAK